MSTHSVYALGDPRTGEVRYIGQSVDVFSRYATHLLMREHNKAKNAWIAELKHAEVLPTLLILEKGVAERDIDERELYWIAHYLTQGSNLTNVNGTKGSKSEQEEERKRQRIEERKRSQANRRYIALSEEEAEEMRKEGKVVDMVLISAEDDFDTIEWRDGGWRGTRSPELDGLIVHRMSKSQYNGS